MTTDATKLISDILKDCEPNETEKNRLNKIAFKIKDQISTFVLHNEKYSFVKEVVFGGSFPRGTWLKNETDVDIFMKFSTKIDLEGFENYGKEIGLQSLKDFSPYLRYADHPYVEA